VAELLQLLREELASRGPAAVGVEIGAHTLPVAGVAPFYVDRVASYAGAACCIDVQADGLALPIPAGELDYLCSSHVMEHLPNPLFGLFEWHRVLRAGGLLYLVVPDKRYTFDAPRPLTAVEHLIGDFAHATQVADEAHVRAFIYETDWTRLQPADTTETKPHRQQVLFDAYLADIARGKVIDIHYHTFTTDSLLALLRQSGLVGGAGALFDLVGSAERYPVERGDGSGVLLRKRGRPGKRAGGTFAFARRDAPEKKLSLVCPATLAPLQLRSGNAQDGTLEVKGHAHTFAIERGLPILTPPPGIAQRRRWLSPLWRKLWLLRAKFVA
jgi:SAM-dependent methyltransferase